MFHFAVTYSIGFCVDQGHAGEFFIETNPVSHDFFWCWGKSRGTNDVTYDVTYDDERCPAGKDLYIITNLLKTRRYICVRKTNATTPSVEHILQTPPSTE